MAGRYGLHDPSNWIDRWQTLHGSQLLAGEISRLALSLLESDAFFDSAIGRTRLRFVDQGRLFEPEIVYVLEQWPAGRILHVLAIRSAGDAGT